MRMDTVATPAPCLAISGYHRSCTSLVAGLLQSAGLNIGSRLLGVNPGQKYGHFEDLDFLDFHRNVLTAQGFGPQGFLVRPRVPVPDPFRAQAQALVETRMGTGQPWGWKDPRTTLFLDFWKGLIPSLRCLFLFRAPWEVVDSLFRRGDGVFRSNPNLAVQSWQAYNEALLHFAERYPDVCLFVEGPAVGADPSRLTAALTQRLGLTLGPGTNCFDPDILIRHPSAHLSQLIHHFFPAAIATYEKLRARAALVDNGARLWEEAGEPVVWPRRGHSATGMTCARPSERFGPGRSSGSQPRPESAFAGKKKVAMSPSSRSRLEIGQASTGSAFSGSMPNSSIAFCTRWRRMSPRWASRLSAASAMHSASTSKNRRNARRVSLRPKPSVPSTVRPPGTQRLIIAGNMRI
jgi:hypothetical protein